MKFGEKMVRHTNLLFVVRKSVNINLFRDIIINSLGLCQGADALICSGFFQENYRGSAYRASLEGNLSTILLNNSINLTTIGIHNWFWKNSYDNFVRNLQRSGVNVTKRNRKNYKWHAKVYILNYKNKNVLGIIGSSNITRPAFGLSSPFNIECDVVIWDNAIGKLHKSMISSIKDVDPYQIIKSYYDEKINKISVHNRLESLKKELIEMSNLEE